MSKRGFGKYFGLAAFTAAAALLVKYLKDFTDFDEAAEPSISNLKSSSTKTKEAVKRTYISIKDKEGVKEAAGDLAKAAGQMAKDAGSIAVTAGKTTVDTVKDIKSKYDVDPEAAKQEVMGNLKEMKDDLTDTFSEAAEKISGIWKSDDDEECEPEDLFSEACAEDVEEAVEEAAEAAGEASEACCEAPCDESKDEEPKPEAPTVTDDTI